VPGSQLDADLWINEYITPTDIYSHGVLEVLASRQTEYQQMHIVRSGAFGKALVLDGKWQSCTGDEFMYHEPLVHPACALHGAPRGVLILGGGEGATVREALKWNTVEKVVMVDIDGEVVEACKQHLPEMHQGAFDDPRCTVIIGDALDYLKNASAGFDVIISDLSDPIEEGPSFKLFTREYFQLCRKALAPGGFLAIQAGPWAPPTMELHVRLAKTVGAVYRHSASYGSFISTYGQPWGFVLGCDRKFPEQPDPAKIDAVLAKATNGKFRMFDGTALLGMMCRPKHVRDAIAAETRIFTLDELPKFFGQGVARM